MKNSITGIIHGRTIQLDQEPGLPDGQHVVVSLTPAAADPLETLPPGEGLRLAFGSWADDGDELDKYLEWNRQQRKIGRPEVEP